MNHSNPTPSSSSSWCSPLIGRGRLEALLSLRQTRGPVVIDWHCCHTRAFGESAANLSAHMGQAYVVSGVFDVFPGWTLHSRGWTLCKEYRDSEFGDD